MKKFKQSILYKKWLEERQKSKAVSEKESQEKQEFEKKKKYMDKAVKTMKRYKRQIRFAILVLMLIMTIFGSSLYGARHGEKVLAAQFREDMQEAVGSAGTAGELTVEQKDTIIDEILSRIKDMIDSGEIRYQGTFTEEEIQKIIDGIEGELLQKFQEYLTKAEIEQIVQNVLSSIENTYTTSEELLQQIENVNKQFYEIKAEIDSLEQDFQNFKNEVNIQIEQKIKELLDKLENRVEINENSILEIRQQIIDLKKEYDLKFNEYNKKLEEINLSTDGSMDALEKRVAANEQAIAAIQKQLQEMQKNFEQQMADLEDTYNARLEELAQEIDVDIETLRIEFKADFADFESVYNIKLSESEKNINARLDELVKNINAAIAALQTELIQTNSNVTALQAELQKGLSEANAATAALKTELEKDISDTNSMLAALTQRVTSNESHIGNTADLQTGNKGSLVGAVNEVFQLVSNGKKLLASTITDKGVYTAADATFEIINENIKKLYTKAFAEGIESVTVPNPAIEYEYHYHTGSASAGGGCYTTPKYHIHQNTCSKHGTLTAKGNDHYVRISCNFCGHKFGDPGNNIPEEEDGQLWVDMYNQVKNEYYAIGKAHDVSITRQCSCSRMVCGKSDTTQEGWKPGCGYYDGEIVSAKIIFAKQIKMVDEAPEIFSMPDLPENETEIFEAETPDSIVSDNSAGDFEEQETPSEPGETEETNEETEVEIEVEIEEETEKETEKEEASDEEESEETETSVEEENTTETEDETVTS